MTIRARCPHCDEVLAFPDRREGQVEECASCTGGLRVPRLLRYRCPHCDHRFMSAPHHGGRQFPCLKCGQDVIVPEYVASHAGAEHGPAAAEREDWGADDAGASLTSDDWFDDGSGEGKKPYGSSFDDDSDVSDETLAPQFGSSAVAIPRVGDHVQSSLSDDGEYAIAGFWYRVLAYLLDLLVLCFVFVPINLALGTFVTDLSVFSNPEDFQRTFASFRNPVYQILAYTVPLAYMTIMEASPLQATLGKLALGLRVEDERGERGGIGRILGRNLVKNITGSCCFLLYIVAAFTSNHQAIHDMIAGTYVTRRV